MKGRAITKLTTSGGPCGDGVEVAVERTGKHETTLTCSRCQAKRVVKIRHGQIDRVGFARLEEGVRRLHEADA
jgi:hypothetical protein